MTKIKQCVRYSNLFFSTGYNYIISNRINNVFNLNPIACYSKSAEAILGLDKPKRPFTPFLRFATELRPALKAKHPEATATDIMKLAGQQWKVITANVKVKLTKDYEDDLKEYKKRKEEYNNSLSDEQKKDLKVLQMELTEAKERKKTKAEYKALGRPKRPVTAYMLFCHTQKDLVKEVGFKNYIMETKRNWEKLTHAERAEWDKKSQHLWDIYREEIKEWEEKMIKDGNKHLVRKSH